MPIRWAGLAVLSACFIPECGSGLVFHPPLLPLALAPSLAPPYAQALHSPHIHAISLSKNHPPQSVVTSVMLIICSPRF